jgi:hypothetical protein
MKKSQMVPDIASDDRQWEKLLYDILKVGQGLGLLLSPVAITSQNESCRS